MVEIVPGDVQNADQLPPVNLPTMGAPIAEETGPLQVTITPRAPAPGALDDVPSIDPSTPDDPSIEPADDDWLTPHYGRLSDNRDVVEGPAGESFYGQGLDPHNLLDDEAYQGSTNLMGRMLAPYERAVEEIGGSATVESLLKANEEVGSAIVAGVGKGVQGFFEMTGEIADVLSGSLGELGYVVWDEKGLRHQFERPDDYEHFTLPKFWTDPETELGKIGAGLVQFVSAMAATSMGTLGTIPFRAARWMSYGAVADSMLDPTEGNLSTMLMKFGVESEVLEYLGTPVGQDAEAAEKLAQRLKNALEGGALGLPFDLGPLAFKAFKALKQNTELKAKALEHLETAQQRFKEGKSPIPMGMSIEDVSRPAQNEMFEPLPAAQDLDALGFYSQALRAAEAMTQDVGTVDQMRKQLLSGGARETELVWTGLDDFLAGRPEGKVSRDEIIEHLRANQVRIDEVEGVKVTDAQVEPDMLPNFSEPEPFVDEDGIAERADELMEIHLKHQGLTLDDLSISEQDALQQDFYGQAHADAWENPSYRLIDETHGYEIEGSDDAGFIVRRPDGTIADRPDENLSMQRRTGDTANPRTFPEAEAFALEDAVATGVVQPRPGKSQYSGWTIPGGENYREILFQYEPEGGPYGLSHFSHDPFAVRAKGAEPTSRDRSVAVHGASRIEQWGIENVLAHVRVSDRYIEGERVLLIEELQSDWHKAIKMGEGYRPPLYRDPEAVAKAKAEKRAVLEELHALVGNELSVSDGMKLVTRGKWADDIIKRSGIRADSVAAGLVRNSVRRLETFDIPDWWGASAPVLEELNHYNALAARYFDAVESLRKFERARPDAPFKTMDERGWPQLVMRRMLRYAVENGYDRLAWTPGSIQKQRYGAPTALYDKTVPKIMEKLIKKFDSKARIDEVDMWLPSDDIQKAINRNREEPLKLPGITITGKMKNSVWRLGQAIMAAPPLVAAGAAMDGQEAEAMPQ